MLSKWTFIDDLASPSMKIGGMFGFGLVKVVLGVDISSSIGALVSV